MTLDDLLLRAKSDAKRLLNGTLSEYDAGIEAQHAANWLRKIADASPPDQTVEEIAQILEQEWVTQESRTSMSDHKAKIQFEASIFTRMAERVAALFTTTCAAAPAAPLLCHTCGTILDPNWLNCPKCEGKARSTPVEKSTLDTTTNEV